MLKRLRISNVILIDSMEISFEDGLNILTGETGAGKSSVLQALTLALGERADTSIIRKDASKAFIEASFEIMPHNPVINILSAAGLEYHANERLVIRRELSATGKNRAFINDQLTQLSVIEAVSAYLVDMVRQHSHQKLLSLGYHREILDTFGNLLPLQREMRHAWEKAAILRKELDELIRNIPKRLREIDICRMELDELNEANLKEGEEEVLFQEYSKLSHFEELSSKAKEINSALSEGRSPILQHLQKLKILLELASSIDPALDDTLQSFQTSLLELEEVSYTLSRYLEKLDADPFRIAEVNERLTLINRLKRKYGKDLQEIENYKVQLEEKLIRLTELDEQIPELQTALQELDDSCRSLASQLSKARQTAALEFESLITTEIRSLNMAKAAFHIMLTDQPPGPHGIDHIECMFSPNVGEQMVSLKDCASGGELSRLLFAIKKVLAGKDHVPTLVFDEIDANLGGETASIVGDKLNELGKQYQVLSITHLPQVASRGDHHYRIFKEEKDGRTFAQVVKLDKKSRQNELARMLGGASFNAATHELAKKIFAE